MNIRQYIPFTDRDFFTAVFIFILATTVVLGSRLSRLTNTHAVRSEQPVDIYLHDDKNLRELSIILEENGLIADKEEVQWAGKLLGWKTFRRGHYEIDGSYSYDVLLSRISRGIQDPISVTIQPGLKKSTFFENLSAAFPFDSAALALQFHDSVFLATRGISDHHLFGRMLPETYSFYWTSTPENVLGKVLNEFQNTILIPNRDRLQELERSIDEIATLASIIELEAKYESEKPRISGLYWNRLERRMYLQADPTVNYAIGERRRLLFEDYKVDHPYNTYVNFGLPPGPITNPSESSIEAALYPEEHDYLYMVANKEGYHTFTETFEEHKRESEKWRRWIREQIRIKEKQEKKAEDVSS